MFSRSLILFVLLLLVFAIAESKTIRTPLMTPQEFEQYKRDHPEVDWDAARHGRWPRPTIDTAWQYRGNYKTGEFKIRATYIAAYREITPQQAGRPPERTQPSVKPKGMEPAKKPVAKTPLRNALGLPYQEVRGTQNAPTIVIDTVRCSNGFGSLALNTQRGRERQSVAPSSENDIHVLGIIPIISDSTQAVPSYGAWINRELNQLNIQSSDANDTRLVQVSFMVQ